MLNSISQNVNVCGKVMHSNFYADAGRQSESAVEEIYIPSFLGLESPLHWSRHCLC